MYMLNLDENRYSTNVLTHHLLFKKKTLFFEIKYSFVTNISTTIAFIYTVTRNVYKIDIFWNIDNGWHLEKRK